MSKRSKNAYNTWDSQAVSDPSTNQAQRCLTCQIGRDGVFSTWYGRKRESVLRDGAILEFVGTMGRWVWVRDGKMPPYCLYMPPYLT